MSTFKKSVTRKLKKNLNLYNLIPEEDNVNLEKHFEKRIQFRENSDMFDYGTIEHIAELDNKTNIRMEKKLPIDDVSDLTIDSVEKIKNLEKEKIGFFITHKNTDAIFIKLINKPKKDSWAESEIKQLLYSEGVTADSLEDMIGKKVKLDVLSNEETKSSYYHNKLERIIHNINQELKDELFGMVSVFVFILLIYRITNSMSTFLLLTVPFILYITILHLSLYNFTIYGDKNE